MVEKLERRERMNFEYLIWFLLALALISTIIFIFCSLKLAASADNWKESRKIVTKTDAETFLLYLALIDKEKCKLICEQNDASAFMYKPYSEIFGLIRDSINQDNEIKIETIVSKISESKHLSAIISLQDLESICSCNLTYKQVHKYLDEYHLITHIKEA